MKKTLLFIASITFLSASSVDLKSEKLTEEKIINLICKKPLKGNKCKCEDVKFFDSEDDTFAYIGDTITVGSIIEGNFIEKNEAIANLYGCQPHSEGWGGYVFLGKNKKNKWEAIDYSTPPLGDCEKIHLKNEKDILICKSNFVQHGIRTETLSLGTDYDIYQGEDNGGAVEENSSDYYNTTVKSYKIVYKGKDIYIVLTVYNEDAKHKNRTKVIKKKLDI